MSTYVIVGGHGKVARLTEPLLTARGDTVNAIIRDRAQVADVAACGAEPVVLDMQMAGVEEMAEVFRGADAVVWSAGAGGGSPERTYGVDRDAAMRSMDAAALAHVDRYVMVSYWGAGRDLDRLGPSDGFRPYAEAKAAADAHLRASSLAWTILGPTGLTMQDPSGLIDVGNRRNRIRRFPRPRVATWPRSSSPYWPTMRRRVGPSRSMTVLPRSNVPSVPTAIPSVPRAS